MILVILAGVLTGALGMALLFMRCSHCRKFLNRQIDEEATRRFQSLAERYDEADRLAMDTALEMRKMAEQELQQVARSVECVLWYAGVTEGDPRDLEWDLRIFQEDKNAFVPMEEIPRDSRVGSWYHGRREPDMFRLADQATDAICGGKDGYRQEFECRSASGDAVWFQEEVRIEQVDPHVWQLFGVSMDITERKRAEEEREQVLKELQEALAKVKQLQGLLPICAQCHKIRDDTGYWNRIESYIQDHAEVQFSHGLCPECIRELYGDYMKDEDLGSEEPPLISP
jgi:PAS domain-containing protein